MRARRSLIKSANGPIEKDYVVVPRDFADDRRKFKLWARKAIDHVLTLPKPKRRPRKPLPP